MLSISELVPSLLYKASLEILSAWGCGFSIKLRSQDSSLICGIDSVGACRKKKITLRLSIKSCTLVLFSVSFLVSS